MNARLAHGGLMHPDFLSASLDFAHSDNASRGAIFTRREIVDLILDLVGYTPDKPLWSMRFLEPAAGHGDFLLPAIERLIQSTPKKKGGKVDFVDKLSKAIVAFEVSPAALAEATRLVIAKLVTLSVPSKDAAALAKCWLVEGDFLVADIKADFTHIAGNPPYVRQEAIPSALLELYRTRYKTMYDRADLYIPFFERSLQLLSVGGRLGFICTDRWTKNKYGGPLRALVAKTFTLTHYVDLVDGQAFTKDVMTYPAITVMERPQKKSNTIHTRIAHRPFIEAENLKRLALNMMAPKPRMGSGVVSMRDVVQGAEPWILSDPIRLKLVRELEARLPTIEEAGCKVGIGVATGADDVYIQPYATLKVESSRKLPLVRSGDLVNGGITWKGAGVINPFEPDGTLVDFKKYPKFARYMEEHATAILHRSVAKRNKSGWFRTIDRIYPLLVQEPKLLIPDIKGGAHITFDEGHYYPHHNLYYIVSGEWDLRALQAVLLSGIATLFVATYSTTMRGGYLRFQAQYLRRIRLPHWVDVSKKLRKSLHVAGVKGDVAAANKATAELYGIPVAELIAVSAAYQAKDANR